MRPIFIVGAPRSGTSVLRAVLNRHPAIGLCDETYYFYYVYNRRRSFGSLANEETRRQVVQRYLETNRIRRLGVNAKALSERLIERGKTYELLFTALLEFYAEQGGKCRFGEKTPQHALVSETLCDLYPGCHLIHIIRDPRDVVASLLRMPWGSPSVLANARVWRECNAAALRAKDRSNYLQVSYESLVTDPAPVLQRVCDTIGEEYRPEMITPVEAQRPREWWFHRAYESISKDRLESWRQQLNNEQASIIEATTSPYLEKLGYSRTAAAPRSLQLLNARITEFACGARAKARRMPAAWYHWIQPTCLAAEETWLDRHTRSAGGPKDLVGHSTGAGH